ncbi:hypothetical protein ANCDUO_21106, partial [Ancylostoma duodenale]
MPSELRSFFASLMCFCELANSQHLWERCKKDLSEDFRNQLDILNVNYDPVSTVPSVVDYLAHKQTGEKNCRRLNEDKKIVVDDVLAAVENSVGNNFFFMDGPGGTGKSFVYNTIHDLLIGRKKKIVCVAWSGIAVSLLPKGRTYNSTIIFGIKETDVIIWDEAPMPPKQAFEAVNKLLQDIMQTRVIFGDKIMVHG